MSARELFSATSRWFAARRPFALVTVVRIFGSAPRGPGAAMAISGDGIVVGSVSGGCIEGAVYETAMHVIKDGSPVLAHYGVSDEDAFAVGLTCGGDIDVYIERIDAGRHPHFADLARDVAGGAPVAAATGLSDDVLGDHVIVTEGAVLPPSRADDSAVALVAEMRAMLKSGTTAVVTVDGGRYFVETFLPPPRMLIFGATDFAAALVRAAKLLGYHVVLCDARAVFATRERFPEADEIIVDQPYRYLGGVEVDERTAVCVLTHDPKFDIPLLETALATPAGYIGALGSRRTHAKRLATLRAAGVSPEALNRLHSPIGLDIGSSTPEETAISIMAEIIASRHAASGRPLRETAGPVRR